MKTTLGPKVMAHPPLQWQKAEEEFLPKIHDDGRVLLAKNLTYGQSSSEQKKQQVDKKNLLHGGSPLRRFEDTGWDQRAIGFQTRHLTLYNDYKNEEVECKEEIHMVLLRERTASGVVSEFTKFIPFSESLFSPHPEEGVCEDGENQQQLIYRFSHHSDCRAPKNELIAKDEKVFNSSMQLEDRVVESFRLNGGWFGRQNPDGAGVDPKSLLD